MSVRMSLDKRLPVCDESNGKHDDFATSDTQREVKQQSSDDLEEHVVDSTSPARVPAKTTLSARLLNSSQRSLIQLPLFYDNKSVSTPALNLDHSQSLLLLPASSEQRVDLQPVLDMETRETEQRNLLGGKKLTYYESTRRPVRRPKLRRAMSLSSSLPDARIGRTRKLYCPRQPPTNLQRTLSISRTSIPIFKKATRKSLTTEQKLVLLCISLVSFFSFLSMAIIAPFFPVRASLPPST